MEFNKVIINSKDGYTNVFIDGKKINGIKKMDINLETKKATVTLSFECDLETKEQST